MPIIEARDALKNPAAIPDNRLYDVVLLATGSVTAAEDALYARCKARLKAGQTPNV